jgi:hypothetical protein
VPRRGAHTHNLRSSCTEQTTGPSAHCQVPGQAPETGQVRHHTTQLVWPQRDL